MLIVWTWTFCGRGTTDSAQIGCRTATFSICFWRTNSIKPFEDMIYSSKCAASSMRTVVRKSDCSTEDSATVGRSYQIPRRLLEREDKYTTAHGKIWNSTSSKGNASPVTRILGGFFIIEANGALFSTPPGRPNAHQFLFIACESANVML